MLQCIEESMLNKRKIQCIIRPAGASEEASAVKLIRESMRITRKMQCIMLLAAASEEASAVKMH